MWYRGTVWCLLVIALIPSYGQQSRRRRQGYNVGDACTTPRNVAGVCMNIKQCALHVDYLINKRGDPGIVQYLQDAVCRKQGNQVITCCPAETADIEKSVNFNAGSPCDTPRKTRGMCINIKRCPELLEMLKRRQEPGVVEYLRSSQCGLENRDPQVCCPSQSEGGNTGGQLVTGGAGDSGTTADNALPGLNVCGLTDSSNNRVVNGKPAALGAWPWMVALGYRSPTKDLDWLCGGSLINSRYILTAAHCITNIGRRKLYLARLGDLNLNDEVDDRASPIDVPVERAIAHENYNPAQHTTDIAIVKLQNRVQFSKLIRPICVPTPNTFPQDLSGYSPFIIGWGAIGYRGPSTTALQEAQIDITDEDTCANAYRNIKGATIDNRVVCALSPLGKDACQGDSGGPLILPKQANYFLLGIVSYGYKCAEPGYPGIYTKVSLYTDWIKRNMS